MRWRLPYRRWTRSARTRATAPATEPAQNDETNSPPGVNIGEQNSAEGEVEQENPDGQKPVDEKPDDGRPVDQDPVDEKPVDEKPDDEKPDGEATPTTSRARAVGDR